MSLSSYQDQSEGQTKPDNQRSAHVRVLCEFMVERLEEDHTLQITFDHFDINVQVLKQRQLLLFLRCLEIVSMLLGLRCLLLEAPVVCGGIVVVLGRGVAPILDRSLVCVRCEHA